MLKCQGTPNSQLQDTHPRQLSQGHFSLSLRIFHTSAQREIKRKQFLFLLSVHFYDKS